MGNINIPNDTNYPQDPIVILSTKIWQRHRFETSVFRPLKINTKVEAGIKSI